MRWRLLVTLLGVAAIAALSGCSNNPTSTSMGTMNIQMTDAPGDFQAVNLVVREVAVKQSGKNGWEVLQSQTHTYDLLQLRNGVFATLGLSMLPAGKYDQLRMKLGAGSNVVVDGVTHPLIVGKPDRNGFKLAGAFTVPKNGKVDLALDFNVAHSIKPGPDGSYRLRPAVHCVVINVGVRPGAIRGVVMPADGVTSVWIKVGADTVSGAMATADGSFMVSMLPAGSYDVVFSSPNAAADLTVSDVVVNSGLTTDMGTVNLQPATPPPPPPAPTLGTITGLVSPAGVPTLVTVLSGSTVVATMDVDLGGAFAIGDLPPGTYDLLFHPLVDYQDVSVTGVAVTAGQNTDVGTVALALIPPPPPPPPPPSPGAIAGQITPGGIPCAVVVMQNGATVTQVDADLSGSFLVSSLPAGTYTVIVHPLFDFADSVFPGVVVNSGQTTNLGSIPLAF